MTDLSDYADRYAAQYDAGGFETVLVGVRRENVLASLRAHPHRSILEIGCGLEPLFAHVDEFESYVVVEPAERFAKNAQQLAETAGNVTVLPMRLEEAANSLSRRFDFVILSSLLHEVPEPEKLLWAIHSLCAPTAVVHVNVPNVRSFHRLLALEMGLIDDLFDQSEMERSFRRHTRFDHERLIEMLARCKFDVLDSGTYFVKPLSHEQMDALFRHEIVDQSIVRGLRGMIKHMPEHGCELYAEATPR